MHYKRHFPSDDIWSKLAKIGQIFDFSRKTLGLLKCISGVKYTYSLIHYNTFYPPPNTALWLKFHIIFINRILNFDLLTEGTTYPLSTIHRVNGIMDITSNTTYTTSTDRVLQTARRRLTTIAHSSFAKTWWTVTLWLYHIR